MRLIFSSRKALLLETPFQASVPSMNVLLSCTMYSMAATVSGLLSTTLLPASTILPPKPQRTLWLHVSASPVVWAKENPGGCPFFAMRWHSLRKLSKSVGKVSNPASRIQEMR